MTFFRRIFYFLFINILVVTTAGVLAHVAMRFFGIEGELAFYLFFYSAIGFGGAFFSLAMSRVFAKKFMGVRLIDPKTATGRQKELLDMVYRMASQARLPEKPEVGLYESNSPNAFATGPSRKKSLVAVSTGLLQNMSDQELEGVIAHEIAHIANGDMVTMTLLQGLINTMVLLAARYAAKLIVSQTRSRSYMMELAIYFGLQIVFSILGSIILCYFSRKREYRADKDGARFSGSENMILALKALQRMTQLQGKAQPAFAMGGGSGGRSDRESYNYLQISGKAKLNWFSTHPPLQHRIARLERSYS